MIDHISPYNITILNPRRDEWHGEWKQSMENPEFVGQVNWELNGLSAANIIAMYFDPSTMSPITLLELGLFASIDNGGKNIILYCPDGYWRKGNVDIVCRRYGVNQVHTFEAFLETIDFSIRALVAYAFMVDGEE